MQISHFFSWQKFPDNTLPFFAAAFRDNGAKQIVLTHHWAIQLAENPILVESLQELVKNASLKFEGSHAPYGPVWDLNSCTPEALKKHGTVLECCAKLGITSYTMHVGEFPEDISKEAAREHSLQTLKALIEMAKPLGILIAVENAEHPGGAVSELLQLRKQLPGPEWGFCFDCGHANLNGGVFDVFEAIKNDVICCHLHDNDGTLDWHWPPGHGNIDWIRLSQVLKTLPRLQSIQNEVNAIGAGVSLRYVCEKFEHYLS